MALITCPDCGSQISSDAPTCPKCGRLMAKGKPKEGIFLQSMNMGCGCIAVVVIVFVVMFVIALGTQP
jgi:predicted nucleic acid-binding Zn ribbon protein